MKKIINNVLNAFGLELRRVQEDKSVKSKKTDRLGYYETITGNYFLPVDAKDDIVAKTIISNNVFEKEVVELAKKHIKEGTAVLDVGANFGQMSILFSGMVGKEGLVYSFEADDFIFEVLGKNVEANKKQKNIKPVFGAVHNVAGKTLFYPVQDFVEFGTYGSYGIDYTAKKGRELKSITIDSIDIKETISFMKIDIQGGDLQAMQGAVKTIEKNKMPILFEYEYHFEDKFNLCFQDYVDFVRSINYKFLKVVNGHNYLIVPA
jgi:FkbM family methyltransferase